MTVADTTFLIDLMRGDGPARALAAAYEAEGWALQVPTVVLHEIHRGFALSRDPLREWTRIREALQGLATVELDAESARIGGQVEGALRAAGTPIQPEDCMIAGIALRRGEAVLTRNVRDFRRVQGLDVVRY